MKYISKVHLTVEDKTYRPNEIFEAKPEAMKSALDRKLIEEVEANKTEEQADKEYNDKTLDEIRGQYEMKFGKAPSNRYKNDYNYLANKINE